jgi:CheY-like chemotaxis protein
VEGAVLARILVIEDDNRARELYREMLERAGYEVTCAADGVEGSEAYRQDPADVVMTDLFMPKKDGVETIRDLRKDYPDIRVLAITGVRGRFSRLPAAETVGAQRTLVKPFDMEDMLKALEELLAEA